MNRRQALSLLAALPLAAHAGAQTRPAQRRVFTNLHGLLLEPNGTLKSWLMQERTDGLASDWLGAGHNQTIRAFTLVPIPSLSNVVTAAAGKACAFAVLGDGRLLSWGSNAGSGLLGTTPLSDVERTASWGPNSNTPVPLATKFDAVGVSTFDDHVLALARDGSVYAWGKGEEGQLGIGPRPVINFKTHAPGAMTYVPFPVRVPDLTDVVAISAGSSHSLALLKDGTVRAWGSNNQGQVGDSTTVNRDRPVQVLGVRNAVAIAAGSEFSNALLADGTVMTWGGPMERGGNGPKSPVPRLVVGASGIRSIAAGMYTVVALTEAGTVMTWGDNTFYELGRGRNPTSNPTVVKGLADVQFVSAARGTGYAVLASGRIMTWGGVREWTRPDDGAAFYSPTPILLWLDGLDQP